MTVMAIDFEALETACYGSPEKQAAQIKESEDAQARLMRSDFRFTLDGSHEQCRRCQSAREYQNTNLYGGTYAWWCSTHVTNIPDARGHCVQFQASKPVTFRF
jgi:hypothetical protein